jgi:CheY-like chemotaxis protein
MSRILILEDDLYRIAKFREVLGRDHDLTFTCYVPDAIKLATQNVYDIMFLDHDLDHEVFVDSDAPNTGYQFCKWLNTHFTPLVREDEANWNRAPSQIIVHSMNPSGVERMISELSVFSQAGIDVRRIPYHVLIDQIDQL